MTGFKHLSTFACFAVVASSTMAADWQESWDSVKKLSIEQCQATFQDYQLQAVCMQNEKNGYKALQKDYGMPHDLASKAKDRCERTFSGQFQLQDVCMKNEKQGYDKMNSY